VSKMWYGLVEKCAGTWHCCLVRLYGAVFVYMDTSVLYCNCQGTLSFVVSSGLIDMQGLYIALCDNVVWRVLVWCVLVWRVLVWCVLTHFDCVYICVVCYVYVKLFSIQFS
jgi:hypothetical protein